MSPALRLFAGPPDSPPPSVTVTLGELLAACGAPPRDEAGNRLWLCDFADEPVLVSPDLAELLHAARTMDEPAPHDGAPPCDGPERRAA